MNERYTFRRLRPWSPAGALVLLLGVIVLAALDVFPTSASTQASERQRPLHEPAIADSADHESDAADRSDSSRRSTATGARDHSPSEPMSDTRSLGASDSYAELASYYGPLAEAGDATARRRMAQIREFCAAFSLSPQNFAQQLDALATTQPALRQRADAIHALTTSRCQGLDGGTPITRARIDLDWAEAVSARDPVATLRVAAADPDLPVAALDHLLDRTLPSADAETLFEIGNALGARHDSEKYADYADPYVGQYAWQIAACRHGGPSMCGPNSPLMVAMCMNGACAGGSFEQAVRALLPGADQARLDRQISLIEQLISQRKNS